MNKGNRHCNQLQGSRYSVDPQSGSGPAPERGTLHPPLISYFSFNGSCRGGFDPKTV
jgi:hypothetical protein